MAEQLKKHSVYYEFFGIPGGNDGLNRGDRHTIDKAMARAREFIKEYLGRRCEFDRQCSDQRHYYGPQNLHHCHLVLCRFFSKRSPE